MVVVLFCLVAVLGIENNKLKQTTQITNEKISDFDHYYEMFQIWQAETIKNNNLEISPEIEFEDENGNLLSLDQLVNTGPKLMIKTSSYSCSVCLEEEFKHINRYISTIGPENVIVLGTGYNQRSLKTLRQSASFNFQLYSIEKLGIPFEESDDALFVFVLDGDMRVKSFFVPEKTLPELSENYYSTLCDIYFAAKNRPV